MRHRGPDDEGFLFDRVAALGMGRLSIVDVAGGHQPIANEDGQIHVVFNGEIYNHGALRRELSDRGHRFTTRTDTEVLVHLYEERGEELVQALNGMFGFAIWDRRDRSLVLARDRLGIKPLYYWPNGGGIAFASELPCFFALPAFRPELDLEAMGYYLALGYIPDPLTAFRGVRKLPPAHVLHWKEGQPLRLRRFWDPAECHEVGITEQEAVSRIRELLDDSVSLRMVADVPVGAFLSGGIDSSSVVATMVRKSPGAVRTFSIGFDIADFDESAQAKELAAHLGTDHTELIVRPSAEDLIGGLVERFGEPFSDASALPTFLVSRLAREQVTVALSGDGGDELFAGYSRYVEMARRRAIPWKSARQGIGKLAERLPQSFYGRNRLLDLGRSRRGRYATTVAMPLDVRHGGVASTELVERLPAFEDLLKPWFDRAEGRDFLTQIALVDVMTYLPGDILTKVDVMSMACSLEARVPFLDHRMVEFALSLPASMKIRRGLGKWVLRKAMEDRLPRDLFRRPKRGFALPLGAWLRNDLRHRTEVLMEPGSEIFGLVDRTAVRRLLREHQRGRRDHSPLIWRIMVLDIWLDTVGRRVLNG